MKSSRNRFTTDLRQNKESNTAKQRSYDKVRALFVWLSGKMMIGKIDTDICVKLEFVSTNISGQYNAIRATVINRTEGEIDKNAFLLKDIIGQKKGYDPYPPIQ